MSTGDRSLVIKVRGSYLFLPYSILKVSPELGQEFLNSITYKHPTNPAWSRPVCNSSATVFPIGFLYRMVYWCKQNHIPYEVIYEIPDEAYKEEKLFGGYSAEEKADVKLIVPLYPIQEEALEALKKNRIGILGAFIRTGKTNVAGALIAEEKKPAFFVVHNNDQLHQAYERFCSILEVPSVGRIGGGHCETGFITVATRQSLMSFFKIDEGKKERGYSAERQERAVKAWSDVSTIIVDEAHHAASPGMIELMKKARRAYRRNGLTATPRREDGREILLEAAVGSVIYRIRYDTAVKHKLAVPVTFDIVHLPGKTNFADSPGFLVVGKANLKRVDFQYVESGTNYLDVYRKAIVENPLRNMLVITKAMEYFQKGHSVGIVVGWKSHGEEIARRLQSCGCEFLFSGYPGKAIENGIYWGKYTSRSEFWDAVREKKERLIVSTLMDEALDLPPLDVIVLAAGGKSVTKFIQRMRNLSFFEGKERGHVVYFMDKAKWLNRHSATTKKLIRAIVEQYKDNKLKEEQWFHVLKDIGTEEPYEKAKKELDRRFPIQAPYYTSVSQTVGKRMFGL